MDYHGPMWTQVELIPADASSASYPSVAVHAFLELRSKSLQTVMRSPPLSSWLPRLRAPLRFPAAAVCALSSADQGQGRAFHPLPARAFICPSTSVPRLSRRIAGRQDDVGRRRGGDRRDGVDDLPRLGGEISHGIGDPAELVARTRLADPKACSRSRNRFGPSSALATSL
jgi:hypothetical protein